MIKTHIVFDIYNSMDQRLTGSASANKNILLVGNVHRLKWDDNKAPKCLMDVVGGGLYGNAESFERVIADDEDLNDHATIIPIHKFVRNIVETSRPCVDDGAKEVLHGLLQLYAKEQIVEMMDEIQNKSVERHISALS